MLKPYIVPALNITAGIYLFFLPGYSPVPLVKLAYGMGTIVILILAVLSVREKYLYQRKRSNEELLNDLLK